MSKEQTTTAIMLVPAEHLTLAPHVQEAIAKFLHNATPKITKLSRIAIASQDDVSAGAGVVADLKDIGKEANALRLELVKPVKELTGKVDAAFKVVTDTLNDAVNEWSGRYQTWYLAEQKKVNDARQKFEKEQREREEEARRMNAPPPPPPAPPVMQVPPKEITGKKGTYTQMRDNWVYTIRSYKDVPMIYMKTVVDEDKVKAAIKNGERNIPGLEIYNDPIAATGRR